MVLCVLLTVSVAVCAQMAALAPGEFVFDWDGLYGWLEANEAQVNDVLAEISLITGIPIAVDPADDSTITVVVEGRDVETLIRAIAGGSTISYIVDPETGEERIEKIVTVSSVDAATRLKMAREVVVEREGLQEKMGRMPDQAFQYAGIGARVRLAEDKQGLWVRPLSGEAPAAKAGLAMGDLVTAVDGRAVENFENLPELVRSIRGPAGSSVTLTVKRADGTLDNVIVVRSVFRYRPGK
jgi:C-terminal processing protease CtpA/Prc